MGGEAELESTGVVIAVKDLARAKTRMRTLPAALRGRLAALMSVVVARAWTEVVDHVVVVTSAPGIGPLLTAHGLPVTIVPDPRRGLNVALRRGEELLRALGCDAVAACTADLPALTAADLRAVLQSCAGPGRWFVRDAAGPGTTLLVARGRALSPAFGPSSAAKHEASGADQVAAAAGVRLDADEPEDLIRAAALGVGDPVAPFLDRDGLAEHTTATVIGAARDGWGCLLASGTRAYAPAGALAADVRRLAPGQRVHLVRDSTGDIRSIWL